MAGHVPNRLTALAVLIGHQVKCWHLLLWEFVSIKISVPLDMKMIWPQFCLIRLTCTEGGGEQRNGEWEAERRVWAAGGLACYRCLPTAKVGLISPARSMMGTCAHCSSPAAWGLARQHFHLLRNHQKCTYSLLCPIQVAMALWL